MAEEVSIEEVVGNNFLGRALLIVLSSLPDRGASLIAGKTSVAVEMTINGVPTPLRPFIQRLEEHFNHAVNQAAAKLIQDRFRDRYVKIDDILCEAERTLKNELCDAGLIEGD